jgi:hypothetical protein|tara:strand:+ start:11202 stop:11303 length:102 start_codon:yes stop_codon:yes gene_type:complete
LECGVEWPAESAEADDVWALKIDEVIEVELPVS